MEGAPIDLASTDPMVTGTEPPPFDDASRPARTTHFDEDGIERDDYDRYVIPHPETGQPMSWTRATTFAKTISDTYTLDMWGRRMTMKGLTLRPDLYALAASTPLSEKKKLDKVAKEAADAAAARAGANLGSALHAFAEQVDVGETPLIPDPWDKDIAAYSATMDAFGFEVMPNYIEQIIIVPRYKVAGKFDRIINVIRDIKIKVKTGRIIQLYAGDLIIGDLKTGRDLSYGWNEIVVQLALYARAPKIWDKDNKVLVDMPKVRQDVGIVMHLPAGAKKCTMYGVDLNEGWRAAQLCWDVRRWRNTRNLAVPLALTETATELVQAGEATAPVPDTADPNQPVVQEPSWEKMIDDASSPGELSGIRSAAKAQGAWTQALLLRGLKRMEKLKT